MGRADVNQSKFDFTIVLFMIFLSNKNRTMKIGRSLLMMSTNATSIVRRYGLVARLTLTPYSRTSDYVSFTVNLELLHISDSYMRKSFPMKMSLFRPYLQTGLTEFGLPVDIRKQEFSLLNLVASYAIAKYHFTLLIFNFLDLASLGNYKTFSFTHVI